MKKKEYNIVPLNPENPLYITQEMSIQCSEELKSILGQYYKELFPRNRTFIYDTEM